MMGPQAAFRFSMSMTKRKRSVCTCLVLKGVPQHYISSGTFLGGLIIYRFSRIPGLFQMVPKTPEEAYYQMSSKCPLKCPDN